MVLSKVPLCQKGNSGDHGTLSDSTINGTLGSTINGTLQIGHFLHVPPQALGFVACNSPEMQIPARFPRQFAPANLPGNSG